MKNLETNKVTIFKSQEGKNINVSISSDTIWLSLTQISALFERDKSVISRHINAVYKEKELEKKATIAKNATVQKEGDRNINRTIETNGRTIEQSEYLFCNKKGKSIKSFKTSYKAMLQKANVQNATIHTMRHTFASHLIMKGVGIRTVQELLGHSSISVTEMYAHLSTGFKKKEIELLNFE